VIGSSDVSDAPGVAARRVAIETLVRIERDHAYVNLALGAALERSGLDRRDRGLVTDLVSGSTRMRRACDHLADRFLSSPPPAAARAALRVGVYQLVFGRAPAHAAVGPTVGATPARYRSLVNAVLRRVAKSDVTWPDEATRLSYPDWIVDRLRDDLGADDALAALERMNEAPDVTARDDGYVQDLASQWVAAAVGAGDGDVVCDLCAAPGGKATALAGSGARVVAVDRREGRVALVAANAARLGLTARMLPVAGDGTAPPLRPASFDHVLVDAPCSGLGVLRRRADARWRVTPDTVARLAVVQAALVARAAGLVRPGGSLTYSVCTMTTAETTAVAETSAPALGLVPLDAPGHPWRPWGSGALLLPQAAGTDGMAMFRWQLPSRR
jgi:16S rRNA (cytosine967-C5)-methyltransferase